MPVKKAKAQLPPTVRISETDNTVKQSRTASEKIRQMRRHPTIFLSRLIVRAAIMSGAWTVESDEGFEDLSKTVYTWIIPHRFAFLDKASAGCLDYGWQPFEKVIAVEDGLIKLKRLKPLLHDITTPKIDEFTGEFIGLSQGDDVSLTAFSSMLVNINAEGDNPYGESYLGNVEKTYDRCERVNKNSDTYDTKIAGAHWIIEFPEGSSMYNGEETKNDVIADKLLRNLQASGSFAIPKRVKSAIAGLNAQSDNRWVIELKEASGSGNNFEERLNRCDKEFVRGFGLPERSILEGQYGTKAEAGEHADLALTGIELLHKSLVTQFNQQVVNQLLELNEGAAFKNRVYVNVQPLSDTSKAFLRQLYDKYMSSPEGSLQEASALDVPAIRDRLEIPYVKDLINDGNP